MNTTIANVTSTNTNYSVDSKSQTTIGTYKQKAAFAVVQNATDSAEVSKIILNISGGTIALEDQKLTVNHSALSKDNNMRDISLPKFKGAAFESEMKQIVTNDCSLEKIVEQNVGLYGISEPKKHNIGWKIQDGKGNEVSAVDDSVYSGSKFLKTKRIVDGGSEVNSTLVINEKGELDKQLKSTKYQTLDDSIDGMKLENATNPIIAFAENVKSKVFNPNSLDAKIKEKMGAQYSKDSINQLVEFLKDPNLLSAEYKKNIYPDGNGGLTSLEFLELSKDGVRIETNGSSFSFYSGNGPAILSNIPIK